MGSGYNPRNYLLVHNDRGGGGSLDPLLLSKWVVSVGLQISTKRDSRKKEVLLPYTRVVWYGVFESFEDNAA